MKRAAILLSLVLTGCPGPDTGTEVTNPDLVANPSRLALASACPGGSTRGAFEAINQSYKPLDAAVDGAYGEEAYPQSFALDGYGHRTVEVVVHVPADTRPGEWGGTLDVLHRVTDGEEKVTEVDYSLQVVEGNAPKATVLCGGETRCATSIGFPAGTTSWPISVANDGCSPLTISSIVNEGDGTLVGDEPGVLPPGGRWYGRVQFEGVVSGEVVIRSDDPVQPLQRIRWYSGNPGAR